MKDGIGLEMAGQFGLRFRLPRKSQGSFTCRKSVTWDRRLRRSACCGFFRPKNPMASAGFEPVILGTRGMLTTRPPTPLTLWDTTDVITVASHLMATLNNEGQFHNLKQVELELRRQETRDSLIT
jgi:hypothetical protein